MLHYVVLCFHFLFCTSFNCLYYIVSLCHRYNFYMSSFSRLIFSKCVKNTNDCFESMIWSTQLIQNTLIQTDGFMWMILCVDICGTYLYFWGKPTIIATKHSHATISHTYLNQYLMNQFRWFIPSNHLLVKRWKN